MLEHCYALTSRAELAVDGDGRAPRLRWRSAPPVVLRPTGANQVHLVQAAGGPLGGDDLGLNVHLDAGARLRVRSAAATMVQPGWSGVPARWTVTAEVADGAALDWCPEPTVVCDGADLRSSMTVVLHGSARALLREVVVLGRAGQRGGCFRGELLVERDGVPLLAHTLLLEGIDAALCGPGGTGGARVVGMLATLGEGSTVGEGCTAPPIDAGEQPGLRWACSPLEGPGRLLLALGDRAEDVARLLSS